MVNVTVDFKKTCGEIKAMNGVNNGPLGSCVRKTSGFELYKNLEIPYARLHDSAFSETYGGEYSVDVHRVFPDFDADENDPASLSEDAVYSILRDSHRRLWIGSYEGGLNLVQEANGKLQFLHAGNGLNYPMEPYATFVCCGR